MDEDFGGKELGRSPEVLPIIEGFPTEFMSLHIKLLRTGSLQDIQRARDRFRDGYNRKYPGRERSVGLVANLMYGPYNLDEQTLRADSQYATDPQKELNARLQHQFVEALLFMVSQSGESNQKISVQLYSLLQAFLCPREEVETGYKTGAFWAGVRNELAAVVLLLESNLRVYIPDDSEVMAWDVRKGIDLVAVSRECAFLIDVKSEEGGRIEKRVLGWQEIHRLPVKLIRLLANMHIVARCVVGIPGSAYLRDDEVPLAVRPSERIRNFVMLRDEVADSVRYTLRPVQEAVVVV